MRRKNLSGMMQKTRKSMCTAKHCWHAVATSYQLEKRRENAQFIAVHLFVCSLYLHPFIFFRTSPCNTTAGSLPYANGPQGIEANVNGYAERCIRGNVRRREVSRHGSDRAHMRQCAGVAKLLGVPHAGRREGREGDLAGLSSGGRKSRGTRGIRNIPCEACFFVSLSTRVATTLAEGKNTSTST